MSVYDTLEYKNYLRKWVEERPGGGRGEYRRMAEALGVSTTLISQVVNGDKHFSLELASDLCQYLGLSDRDADHFLLLVEYGRAGTHSYRQRLKRRVESERAKALKLSERLDKTHRLTDAESAIYYSSWAYTAITHLVATDPKLSLDDLTERLKLPRHSVAKIMDFLMETGILVHKDKGLEVGPKHTHIGADSPLVVKHHQNWRLQGFSRMAFASDEDMFLTAPMSLSRDAADQIRRELPTFFEKIVKIVEPSPSEVVRCLNIDWFGY